MENMQKYLWEENASDDLKVRSAEKRTVILPLGAIEDHGPHLPVGTDNYICETVCNMLAEKTGDLVLPVLKYTYVWSLGDRTGTISLSFDTLKKVIEEIALELYRQDFGTLVCLDAHIGNTPVVKAAFRDIIKVRPEMKCMYFAYLDSASEIKIFDSPRASGKYIHACEIETSAMLYAKPETVDMSKAAANYPEFPPRSNYLNLRWSEFTEVATLGDPTCASSEKGRILLETAVRKIAGFIEEERGR